MGPAPARGAGSSTTKWPWEAGSRDDEFSKITVFREKYRSSTSGSLFNIIKKDSNVSDDRPFAWKKSSCFPQVPPLLPALSGTAYHGSARGDWGSVQRGADAEAS